MLDRDVKINLIRAQICTPLGKMVAVGDEERLYLLEFAEDAPVEKKIKDLEKWTKLPIEVGRSSSINSIEKELELYFKGELQQFHTPLFFIGSPFQVSVWQSLMKISYGTTKAYSAIAALLGKPRSYRAVARANGTNRLVIVIPCHRVIQKDEQLGGYSSGLHRKEWLLNHERKYSALSV